MTEALENKVTQDAPALDSGGVTAAADGQTVADASADKSAAGDAGEFVSRKEFIEVQKKYERAIRLFGSSPVREPGAAAKAPEPAKAGNDDLVAELRVAFDSGDRDVAFAKMVEVADKISDKKLEALWEQENARQNTAIEAAKAIRRDWNSAYPEFASLSDSDLRDALDKAHRGLGLDKKTEIVRADFLDMFEAAYAGLNAAKESARGQTTAQVGTTAEAPAKTPARGSTITRQVAETRPDGQAVMDALLNMGTSLRPKP